MKLNIDGVQAFVLIAQLGSFQRAAEKLSLDQTALTRRLQRLESYLGLKLLNRTTRSVSLTAVGRDFMPQAQRLVDELTHSVERLKGVSKTAKGDVTIACLAFLANQWLPSVVKRYAANFPENRISVLDRNAAQVTEAVKQGRAEFGLNILTAKDKNLEIFPLLEDPYMLFCLEGHPVSRKKSVTWSSLRELDLITLGDTSESRLLIGYQLARRNVDIRGRYSVEHLSTALGLVSAGVGVAILPASTLWTKSLPMVHQIPLVDPVIKRTVGLIKPKGSALSPAAEQLYSLIREQMIVKNNAQR